jgi:hypothetical protein
MIFLLGLLGFLQAVCLPGLIVYRLFNINTRKDIFVLIVFGISISINSNLVFILSMLGFYVKETMLLIILIEFLYLYYLFIFKNKKKETYSYIFEKSFIDDISNIQINNLDCFFKKILKYIYIVLIVLFLYTLLGSNGLRSVGEVFTVQDAVMSWNRWAVELATIGRPFQTAIYPQLVPALLSLPYVLMQDVWIQFFSYSICLIFPTCMFLITISLFKKFPIASFIVAIIFFIWPLKQFVHYVGLADLPVAIIGFLAASAIIWGYKENEITRIKCLILSSFFLGAAGATKQHGLVLFVFFPILIYEFGILKNIKYKLKIKLILLSAFIALFIALPWHIYVYYLIFNDNTISSYQILTQDLHYNRTYVERILRTIDKWPRVFIFTILAIPGLFIQKNKFFSIFGIFIAFLWMIYFSYDSRNSYTAILFLSFSIGISIEYLFILKYEQLKLFFNTKIKLFRINYAKKFFYISLSVLLISIFYAILKSDNIKKSLYKRQDRQVLYMDYKEHDNKFIVDLLNNNKDSIFITNDLFIQYIYRDYNSQLIFTLKSDNFEDNYNTLIDLIKKYNNKTIYLYLTKYDNIDFINKIENNFKLLFFEKGLLYEIDDKFKTKVINQ